MGAFEIGAVGLLLAFTAVLLRDLGWRGAAVFSAFALVLLFSLCIRHISELSEAISSLSSAAVPLEAAEAVLKITGVGVLTGAAADICRELGENGIARGVALAGRLEILCLALPFLQKIIALGVELLQ